MLCKEEYNLKETVPPPPKSGTTCSLTVSLLVNTSLGTIVLLDIRDFIDTIPILLKINKKHSALVVLLTAVVVQQRGFVIAF